MRSPGEILLVSCYELGRPPHALASAAAFLERAGFHPAMLDASVEGGSLERAARARLAAVAVPMHTAARLAAELLPRLRAARPDVHVAFFGHYAVLNAAHWRAMGVDSVLGGESEAALVRLAEGLERGTDRQLGDLAGRQLGDLAGRQPGDLAGPAGTGMPLAGAGVHLERLDFPVPSRGALPPLDRYARLERHGRRELAGYVEASRGCRHLCRHCPVPAVYGGRFFVVPVATVLADIAQQVAAGATHVTFGDPDFLNGPGHALAVLRAAHAAFPELTFDVTAKVEHLLRHRRHLPELAATGVSFVVSAVESLSDTVLGHLAKGHTRADVAAALAATRAAGLVLRPTWVAFTPWTSRDDYLAMLDFVLTEGLVDHVDPVQWTIRLLVPPGSLLAELPALRSHLDDLDPAALAWRWRHPDPGMDALQAAVAGAVEAGTARAHDAREIFRAVLGLAEDAVGRAHRALPPGEPGRAVPPRLTEPWFC